MAFKKIVFTALINVMTITFVQAQTTGTIDSLQKQEQNCLDKGAYMLGCAKTFYFQMDSMLNVVYAKLRIKLDSANRVRLKKEELEWIKSRDSYFKTTYNKFKENNPDRSPYGSAFGAQDDAMFMYDDNAKFIRDRVLELLQKLNNQ